jgi:RNA polymerase sigma factor (sigma-70 family)
VAGEVVASEFENADFEGAFARLFTVAMGPAMRILRNVAAAEDVAAEVLARTYADWRRLGGQPWLEAWTVRVATNLAIDHVRRSKRPLPAVQMATSGELEVRMDLASAVARLPKRQREAVSLRYFGDLSEQEVAALMDVSVGSVKKHVHRGLASIRVDLGESFMLGSMPC